VAVGAGAAVMVSTETEFEVRVMGWVEVVSEPPVGAGCMEEDIWRGRMFASSCAATMAPSARKPMAKVFVKCIMLVFEK